MSLAQTFSQLAQSQIGTNFISAYHYRNRLVNPAMSIDQANEGTSITLTGSNSPFVADQWATSFVQTGLAGTTTAQTVTDAPTALPGGRSLKFTMGTGHAISAGDFGLFSQHIEAYNLTDLAFGTASASPVSISFWVKTSLTGATFSVAMLNTAGTRTYLVNYTVATANTWTKVTLSNIPGDITGTWVTETNGIGMQLFFTFGVGSTFQGVAGWQTGSFFGTSANTNLLATTGATFQLTGVQLEPGTVCTPLERRPFPIELAICQRYYAKTYDIGTVPGTATTSGYNYVAYGSSVTGQLGSVWKYPTTMRTAPVVTTYAPSNGSSGNVDRSGVAKASFLTGAGMTSIGIGTNDATSASSLSFHATADARL